MCTGRILDEDLAAANRKLEQDAQRTLAERETNRAARRKQIEAERSGAEDELGRQLNEANRNRRQSYQDELSGAGQRLQQARKDWEAALAEAARKRKAGEEGSDGSERLRSAVRRSSGRSHTCATPAEPAAPGCEA